MKKFLAVLLCLVLLLASIPVYSSGIKYFYDGGWHDYDAAPISLQVDGEMLQSEMPPILFDGSSVVPARVVFEKLGAQVNWDGTKSQVGISMGDTNMLLTINDKNAVVNGSAYDMQIAPKIINNSTMIPVRFVAEALGMKVEWKDAERVIKIDSPEVRINDIQGNINDSKFRITISADSPIRDYSAFQLDGHPRVVVDIKKAALNVKNTNLNVSSSYVYGIRSAQNSVSPNTARIVADLNAWTDYTVSLSENKKELYMDFNNDPTDITGLRFSKEDGTEVIELDMKYFRQPYIASASGGKMVIEVPMAKAAALQNAIEAKGGSIIKSIQVSQSDAKTVRLTMDAQGQYLFEAKKTERGTKLQFSPPVSKNISYINKDHPLLTLSSERIGFNYFNYKFKSEGSKYTLTVPSKVMDIEAGKLVLNDNFYDFIDIVKNNSTGMTDVVFNSKKPGSFIANSVGNNERIVVETFAGSQISTENIINTKIKNKVVVIDPGHGGSEPGAVYDAGGIQIKEKDINLEISLKLYEMLKKAGIKAYLTRKEDKDVGLVERADMANQLNAALFISVHNNSGSSWENGTMTLFYPSVYDTKYNITGERAAQIAQEEMLKTLGTTDRGVWKRPRLAVLNNTKMPAILAEVGYVSNDAEREKLLTDAYRKKAAEALYKATVRTLTEMVSSKNTSVLASGQVQRTQSSVFDLSIQLSFAREKSGKAADTLENQRNEARKMLLSKLDEATVNKIMEILYLQKDYSSYFWDDEIENENYNVWVRCLKNTGIATVDLIKK